MSTSVPHDDGTTVQADAAQPSPEELQRSFLQFEDHFRQRYFLLWLATLIGPWLVTFALIGLGFATLGSTHMVKLVSAAGSAFVALGRFVITQPKVFDVPAWELAVMVTYEDVMVALFFAFHVGFMYRIPWIGPKIAALSVDGEVILRLQPWMRRFTFLGLVAFIAFPLAATGSVGGAIFGRLLGLSRWATFWGSSIGAVLGNAAMYYFTQTMLDIFPENSPITKYGGLVIILLIIVVLERRYAYLKKSLTTSEATPPPSPTDTANDKSSVGAA